MPNAVTMSEFEALVTVTDPVPSAATCSPCLFSQYFSATSWVLPSWGLATVLPSRSLTLVMSLATTNEAPPDAAPEITLIAAPLDWVHALTVGLGPT